MNQKLLYFIPHPSALIFGFQRRVNSNVRRLNRRRYSSRE